MPQDRFIAEILAQPAALRRAGAAIAGQTAALEALAAIGPRGEGADRGPGGIDRGPGGPDRGPGGTGDIDGPVRAGSGASLVILTAMGGSLEACRAILPALAAAGVTAVEIETAELVNARRGLLAPADLVVLVSQSGHSAEALRLAGGLRDGGGPALCVVTNEVPNPVGDCAAVALATRAGPEEAPSTGSFTTSLLALDAVAAVLGGRSPAEAGRDAALEGAAAAAAVEALLGDHEPLAGAWRGWLGECRDLFVLGRGVAAGAAGMGALILKEATAVHAEAMSGAAFRHGPLEQAGPGTAVAIVALDEATLAFDAGLAVDLLGAGSPVAWIGPAGSAPPGTFACAVPGLPGAVVVAPAVVPFQLLAWRMARERGAPGEFLRAGKVTTKE